MGKSFFFSRTKHRSNQETHDIHTLSQSHSQSQSQSNNDNNNLNKKNKSGTELGTSKSSSPGSDHLHSSRATFRTRLVKAEDEELAAMALDTKLSIDWPSVMLSARVGPARWRRQEPQSGDFAVYTRQESQRFGVLAVGLVPGCAAEILNVLQSKTTAQYEQRMAAVFEDQFKEGSFVHTVDVANVFLPGRSDKRDGAELTELSVKTVTFNKSSWLSNYEEWCYTDAVYRNPNSNVVEKHMTTMSPGDIVAGLSSSRTKYIQDVTCSYLLRPGSADPRRDYQKQSDSNNNQEESDAEAAGANDESRVTRVAFYAEFVVPKQFKLFSRSNSHSTMGDNNDSRTNSSSSNSKGSKRDHNSAIASEKTVKQRLLKLAESTTRLIALVRRQRLGLQVLVDNDRFFPPTNTPCHVCTSMLLIAKLCRLCGHGVCGDCSQKHERARQPRVSPKLEITHIRVCASCMERVDQADFTNVAPVSLLGTQLAEDAPDARPAATLLKDLLQDALLTAPSPTRKACVMSVIKCVLDQENTNSSNNSGSFSGSSRASSRCATPVVLTPMSSDVDYVEALDYLDVEQISADASGLRSDDTRSYQFDSSDDPKTVPVPTPVPANEEERLKAVRRLSVAELSSSAELEILCEVAAKEMGCASSVVSLIDRDTYYVVATNNDQLRNAVVPRDQSMCSHTIMENSPLMVRHPEADIRFSAFASVAFYGVRYYCAFPILGEDDHIVGTMCCVNDKSLDISTSQFAALKKLATTASKIVRVQSAKQPRAPSMTTSSASTTSS